MVGITNTSTSRSAWSYESDNLRRRLVQRACKGEPKFCCRKRPRRYIFWPAGPKASNADWESWEPTDVERSGKRSCLRPEGLARRPWVVPAMGRATIHIMPLSRWRGMEISLISAPSSPNCAMAACEPAATLGSVIGSEKPSFKMPTLMSFRGSSVSLARCFRTSAPN